MHNILLDRDQTKLVNEALVFSRKLSGENKTKLLESYTAQITSDLCADIQLALGDYLQYIGFDDNYEPTPKRVALENLIAYFTSLDESQPIS